MSISGTPRLIRDGIDAAERLLALAERNVRTMRAAGRDRLRVAAEWAELHQHQRRLLSGRPDPRPGGHPDPRPAGHPDHRWTEVGATCLPVQEYAAAELAVSLQVHPLAALRLMGDAIDLRHRLPRTWAAVEELRLDDWVARKIVSKTRDLADDLALVVDAQIAEHLGILPPGRLFAVVDGRVAAADVGAADDRAARARGAHGVWESRPDEQTPETAGLFIRGHAADLKRFRESVDHVADRLAEHSDETMDQLRARAVGILADPAGAVEFLAGRNPTRGRTVLYVHTTLDQLTTPDHRAAGVARVEDIGPFTRRQLVDLLGHEHITVQPVVDLADAVPADAYEVPASLAEIVHLTKPADAFPHAGSLSRRLDHDHTVPYDPGGPPGQTSVDNLGKLSRRHHRVKTHAPGWSVTQLAGNRYLWITPHGRYRMTDAAGTHVIPVSLHDFQLIA